jgi:hypothetical protein
MENKFISVDELKSLYFKDESKLFSYKSKKQDFHIKSTTEILSNISSNGSFKKVKDTYRLNLILSKILLKSQMNWITYAYYKDKKLVLGAFGHIGQSELNMQKYLLVESLKKIERYSDIESVSIYRDENKSIDITTPKVKSPITPEKSYGIFDNYLEDELLYKIVERIKQKIRNSNY